MRSQDTEDELVRVRTFIESHEWHFAKTMPHIPHWYCLRKDKSDVEEFLWFARYIKEHGIPGQFYGKTYCYFYLDGYKYWSMDESPEDCDLINRDIVETQDSVYYTHYSFILTGSLENVLKIFSRHESPLCKSDFHGDDGYVFIVPEKVAGESGLVKALRECPDVMALSTAYSTTKETYLEMCKKSIVPVE